MLDDEQMTFFADWFAAHVGNPLKADSVYEELPVYFATALEFIVIGAAGLECEIA